MTEVEAKELIRKRLNNFRTVDRIVDSEEFKQCLSFIHAGVVQALGEGDVEYIKSWVKATLKRELCEFSIFELRKEALKVGIKNYTHYTKTELLVQIVQAKNELKQTEENAVRMPCDEQHN